MPVDPRFTVRAYREGDEEQILSLFARSFHAPRTREHFDWKYRSNPTGAGHISLAFDASSLVGHYAGYPVRFWKDGQQLLAHQVGDTMTDRTVRHIGRGPTSVLGITAGHFYQTFCDGTVAFNYGFNVSNIQRFSLRFLRSDRVEPVHYRVASSIAQPSRLERWLRGYKLELIARVDGTFDELFARVAPHYGFLVQRDASYVDWRYLRAPERQHFVVAVRKRGRLVGWSAFRLREDVLLWGDALFDPLHEPAIGILLRHVAHAYRASQVECWFPPRPQWFSSALDRLGFVSAPQPQDLSLMCVPFTMPDATEEMRRSLYYSMGDSDLF
jgi:hypothetical protein